MKKKRAVDIVMMTLICMGINIAGKWLAEKCSLPLWFDSLGTVAMAYLLGPYCGAVVGFASNIVCGFFVQSLLIFSLVGIGIGVLVGVLAKKRMFESTFGAMSTGMALSLFCTVFSCVCNMAVYHGLTGNVWGNQVCEMYQSIGLGKKPSYIIGQFYIEFLDKIITVMIFYAALHIVRAYRRKRNYKTGKKVMHGLLIVGLLTGVCSMCGQSSIVMAKEQESIAYNYASYTQSTYTDLEGLSAGEANDIAQTKNGLLWIGTYAGLYSYDGIKFTMHSEFDSVKNVNCLYVDEEGRMWIGTNDNGLSIMIDKEIINVIEDTDGLPSNSVRAIERDSNGNYYIGTSFGIGIVSLNGGVNLTETITEITDAISMSTDNSGNLATISEEGTLYMVRGNKIVLATELTKSNEVFTSCYFMEDGKLLVGTSLNHVMIYNVKGNELEKINEYTCENILNINSFSMTENGEIFMCSDNGIGYFDKEFRYTSLNTNSFNSSIEEMTVDYQGNLWFTSSRHGLLKLCQSEFKEIFSEVGLEKDVVNTVTKWDDILFFGTDSGLKAIDDKKMNVVENELTEEFRDVRIRCLMVDADGNMWIATMGNGFYEVEKNYRGKYNVTRYSSANGAPGDRFRCLIQLSDGTIVASGNDGVAYVKNNRIIKVYDSESGISNIKTLCLIEASEGCVYAGSDGGGITILQDGKVTGEITKKDGLSSNVILRMVFDDVHGGIFVVTSNGLCYIDKEGKVKSLNRFPYSNNFDLVMDKKGSAWVLSSAGIYIADIDELIDNENMNYELISKERGLRVSVTANAWNYVDEKGNIFISGDTGVCMVNMNKYDNAGNSYRMILDEVRIDGKEHKINRVDDFVLDSSMSRLEFEPQILNYSLNDPYVSYYLEGFDKDPSIVLLSQLETITYTNLGPGKYVFHIAILNNRKTKALEIGSYSFVKEKEMYQKWWFKIYALIVAGLAIAWLSWFITRSQIQKKIMTQQLQLEYAKKQIEMGNETILSIARTVDAKDANTSQHSFRVSEYSVAIAKKYGFSHDKCENLRQMAMLHDIGKIGIPDAILNKPGRLTDEEYEVMKTHVIKGGDILKDFTLIDNVDVGALYHHERYDGKGYCSGLKGEEIPLEARIIGIADAFDAMTANRVYRKQLDLNVVIDELNRCSGTQFDPKLVDILLELIDDGIIDVNELYHKSTTDQEV